MTVHTYFESPLHTLQADAQKVFKVLLNPTRVWKMFLSLWKTLKFNQMWALVLKIRHLHECQSTH